MTLYINACVREESRTKRLAEEVLRTVGGEVCELVLENIPFPVVNQEYLRKRDALIARSAFDDPLFALARQFAAADRIVIAAPYWDLSFPASLKQYFELINVLGITFLYTDDGYPRGLCRAGELIYVATAGGQFVPHEYGFGYVKALAENFYGIKDVRLIEAGGLDIRGADPEAIMQETIEKIRRGTAGRS